MANQILQPFQTFYDKDGQLLSNGYIYLGTVNLNPETNPVAAYWDRELTLPAAQPIRTINGRPSRNGTQSDVYVAGQYSITVRDKNGELVSYSRFGNSSQRKLGELVSVFDYMTDAQVADVMAGTLLLDVTTAIQAALSAITTGQELVFPAGKYKVTNYLTITSKSNFQITMNGIVVPSGTLNNLSSGLLFFTSCTNFTIIPNIVNATYASTINLIRVDACDQWKIIMGMMDVKYNTYDGSAGIQLGANTTNGRIWGNYIRAGYGVLCNNVTGVSNITINGNEIVGQKAYGSTGTGDAVEFNCTTYGASHIYVNDNKIHGFVVNISPSRVIGIGFAKVSNFSVNNNDFWDCEQENIHIEDGCSDFTVIGNTSNSGIMGLNISPNTNTDISNFVVSGNKFNMPVMPSYAPFTIDYGAAILLNTNSVGTGISRGFSITGNVCNGTTGAARGLAVYDAAEGTITGNVMRNFPRAGYDFRKFPSVGTGISDLTITGNKAITNGWNYIVGGLTSGSAFTNAGPLTRVLFDQNTTNESALLALDYNIEISAFNGSVIRIPLGDANRKLSAGVVMYENAASAVGARDYTVTTAGGNGTKYAVGDSFVSWSKVGSGTAPVLTVTFASYATANIPAIVEIWGVACAANSASQESVVAKYFVFHSTAVNGIAAFGTDDKRNAPTVTPTTSGLGAIFTFAFASGFTYAVGCKVFQPNVRDQTLGGVVSIV